MRHHQNKLFGWRSIARKYNKQRSNSTWRSAWRNNLRHLHRRKHARRITSQHRYFGVAGSSPARVVGIAASIIFARSAKRGLI